MFKLIALFALVASAFAAPQPQILLNNGLISSPLGLSSLAYGAHLGYGAPLAYSSPIAYRSPVSYSVPAPYAYSTGNVVSYAAEPVEQHGYKIAY